LKLKALPSYSSSKEDENISGVHLYNQYPDTGGVRVKKIFRFLKIKKNTHECEIARREITVMFFTSRLQKKVCLVKMLQSFLCSQGDEFRADRWWTIGG